MLGTPNCETIWMTFKKIFCSLLVLVHFNIGASICASQDIQCHQYTGVLSCVGKFPVYYDILLILGMFFPTTDMMTCPDSLFMVRCCGFISSPLLWFYFWSIAVVLFPVHCCGSIYIWLLLFYFQTIAVVLLWVPYSVLYWVNCCGSITRPLMWFNIQSIVVVLFPEHCCGSTLGPILCFYIESIDVVLFPIHCYGSIFGPVLWF